MNILKTTKTKFLTVFFMMIVAAILIFSYVVHSFNYLYMSNGWDYSVVDSGFDDLSGLTHDHNGNLLISEESVSSKGRIISFLKDGSRKTLYVGLDEPDVVREYKGGLMVSEEQGIKGLSLIKDGVKTQFFSADSLEGFDISADGNSVYAVEDTKSGRLLKYDLPTQTMTVLASELSEPEGVCVAKDYVYFTEKKGNTFNRISLSGERREILSRELNKPSAVHCDNKSGNVWVAEERQNFGRLLRFNGKNMEVVARFLGEPQEISSLNGSIFISDQRRGTIFKIFRKKSSH